MNIKKHVFQLSFFVCIIIGLVFIFLRFYGLENYPLEANQDELSNIYDGYSICETGADRWGAKSPVMLRGFGHSDFRPPLQAYVCAASIKCFGFSVFAGRFPSAAFGCISLLLLYVTAKKIGGALFALFAVLFAGLSPWHILFSRMAHEGAILPAFFMILFLYLWLKVKETNYNYKYLVFTGLTIGVATNVYQSTKLIFFFIAILTCVEMLRNNWSSIKSCMIYCCSIFIGAVPQFVALIKYPEHFFSRANGTTKPFSFTLEYFQSFLSDFIANISPHYLFFSFGESNNLSVARLLSVEALFFYIGLILLAWVIKKTNVFNPLYLYILLFLAILPSALTYDSPHALRASSSIILLPLFSAAGVLFVWERLKNLHLKKAFVGIMLVLIVSNTFVWVYRYANDYSLRIDNQQHGLVKLCKNLNQHVSGYDRVYIEDQGNQPYIYVATYCGITPAAFQASLKKVNQSDTWDHFTQLGKYYFYSKSDIQKALMNTNTSAEKNLILLRSKEDRYRLIDRVFIDGQVFYYHSK